MNTQNQFKKRLNIAKKALAKSKPTADPPRYGFDIGFWRSVSKDCPLDAPYILDGIQNGFDIDVPCTTQLARDRVKNLPTTTAQKAAVSEWILEKRKKNAIWGPFKSMDALPQQLHGLRVSPLGCVPKGDHHGKKEEEKEWRVIHHLSHPKSGTSVNSSIDDEFKEVEYVKFREVVQMMVALGVGARIWTIDAKDAYLRVPIKERCYKYMGFWWMGLYYAFTCLSFGLASACRIYTRFADFVLWVIVSNTNPNWWKLGNQPIVYHYIDDFFGGAPAQFGWIADKQFNAVIEWFGRLGIPTKPSKCKSPRTRLKILGFVYDTIQQMVFIPKDKLRKMVMQIDAITNKRSVTQGELLSLIGKLRWASACIYAGPAFVRRMEESAYSVRQLEHHIRVRRFEADLIWWKNQLLNNSNGISFSDILRKKEQGDVHVLTDASTGIGMGGWNRDGNWFRFRWTDHPRKDLFKNPKKPDIFWKEMCAIATACTIWGGNWSGKSVTFWCDNEACVYSMAKKKCGFERGDVMELIRWICHLANRFNFHPYFIHIRGKDNLTADALSRFDIDKFKSDINGITMDAAPTNCTSALDQIVAMCF